MDGSKRQNLGLLPLVVTPPGEIRLTPPSCLNRSKGRPSKRCWCAGAGGVWGESPNWGGGVEVPRKPKRDNKGGGVHGSCRLADVVWGSPPTPCGKPLEHGYVSDSPCPHFTAKCSFSLCVSLMS